MATLSYTEQSTPYADTRPARAQSDYVHHGAATTIFLWVAWALAAAFWSATFTTALGILEAVSHPTPATGTGGADAAGVGYALMDVVGGIVVLGLALAYGLYRDATRDKRLDPVTDASTAALYDAVEPPGGDHLATRSPKARAPQDRSAQRAIDPGRA